MTADQEKRAAGFEAAGEVADGMIVGLGTGSTAAYAIEAIGEKVAAGELHIRAVCTSRRSEELARRYAIPIIGCGPASAPDIYIDGADQIDAAGRMIKGGGGALLREKIVAYHSKRRIIIVDRSKVVERLGIGFPLPLAVTPFAAGCTARWLEQRHGCEASLRLGEDAHPYLTDDDNHILDCAFPDGLADPAALEATLAQLPGIVETGLFLNLCDEVLIGTNGHVDRIRYEREASAAP